LRKNVSADWRPAESTASVHYRLAKWTYLCDANPECFAMANDLRSEEDCRRQIEGHECPAPPRRGLNPTGKTLLEKSWDELDDVIDAIKAYHLSMPYCFRDMNIEQTKGYARGIAECITFFATPYFRIPEDVLRQALKRWKMRQGLEPFSPTPSYRWNPIIDEYRNKVRAMEGRLKPDLSPAATKKAVKSTRATKAAPPKPPVREFTSAEASLVAESLHSGKMTADTLAEMFGVTISRILAVAGPAPGTKDSDGELMSAFIVD
jgi:hypothetical protein